MRQSNPAKKYSSQFELIRLCSSIGNIFAMTPSSTHWKYGGSIPDADESEMEKKIKKEMDIRNPACSRGGERGEYAAYTCVGRTVRAGRGNVKNASCVHVCRAPELLLLLTPSSYFWDDVL